VSDLKYTAERDIPEVDYMQPRFYQGFFAYVFARPYTEGKFVLDGGCGEGYGTAYLAEVARAVVGVDIDCTCVWHAVQRYGTTHANVTFACMDLCRLGFPQGTFDAVVSFAVIEHVPDYRMYLHELARVVRADGVVIMEALNRQTPISLDPWHYKEFNASELRAALAEYFADVEIFGMVGKTQRAIQYRRKRERVIRLLVRLGACALRRRLSHSQYLRLYLFGQKIMRKWLYKRHLRGRTLTVDDFTVIRDDIERAWSFFAVCRRPYHARQIVTVPGAAAARAPAETPTPVRSTGSSQ